MFGLIKKVFIMLLSLSGSLDCVAKAFDYTKCLSLKNGRFLARRNITDLYPEELQYYLLMFSLDRCNGSCNALDHLSSKICVSNKTKDVNLYVFNIITEINE